jgi:hypothetical protein
MPRGAVLFSFGSSRDPRRRRVEPELCPEQAQLMPFDVVHRDAAPALG